ncbi:unnamed protein product [Orchesella dallaii]|uniref:Tudor domain-containing protein n=1 Tax=Orchesella dallaii TaxID=48710 RepID=A0ABP1PMB0_9HEXA
MSRQDKMEFFFPPPVEESWIDKMGSNTMRHFFQSCLGSLKGERDKMCCRVDQLPAEFAFIEPSTLDTGHIVRYVSPWDFHMILNSSVDYLLKNPVWTSYFQDGSTTCIEERDFTTAGQLFRGLTILLSLFVKFLHTQGICYNETEYSAGDLVIAVVPRDLGGTCRHFGYRGVIVRSLDVITQDNKAIKNCYMVHLMDTGEERIVSKKFIRSMPPNFIVFPPLAVKCALHGVSPVGANWSKTAKEKVMKTFAEKRDVRIFAEFYSRKTENYHRLPYCIDSFLTKEPYFLELFVSSRYGSWMDKGSTNLSELLISKNLALEWSLLPQRPSLRKKVLIDKSDGDSVSLSWCTTKKDCLVTRDEALLLSEPCPVPIKGMSEKEVRLEISRILSLKQPQMRSSYMPGMENVMTLLIPDSEHILRKPCVPSLFTDKDKII